MARSVREIMSSNPKTVQRDTPVVEAARLMGSEDVGALPVVDGERLVGMVTDRDIALRVVAEGSDPRSTTVGEIQSGDPVSVEPDQELDRALQEMAQNQVRRLPVVEGDRLVGVVAQADVAREVGAATTGRVVEEISE
jgi:CBS domain-containing protein